jgi:uncharacterized membrane protein
MQNPPPTQQGYGYGQPYGTPPNAPLSTPPGGGPNDKTAIGLDGKITSALGYPIGLIAIIEIIIEKENRFARFHSFQSLLLHAAWIVIFILLSIVMGIAAVISGTLAALMGLVVSLLSLVYFGSLLFCAYKAYQGETFKLPVIGDMAANFANK